MPPKTETIKKLMLHIALYAYGITLGFLGAYMWQRVPVLSVLLWIMALAWITYGGVEIWGILTKSKQ